MKSVGKVLKSPVPMSHRRVVTPTASTRSLDSSSLNRAIPHTSLSLPSDSAMGKAICPAGPVMRIFSSRSMMRTLA